MGRLIVNLNILQGMLVGECRSLKIESPNMVKSFSVLFLILETCFYVHVLKVILDHCSHENAFKPH
jgi:hypothetical protein